MEQARALIVSDDAEFVDLIVQSWRRSSCPTEFAVSSIRGPAELLRSAVLVMDGPEALAYLAGEVSLAIVITGDAQLPEVGNTVRRLVPIRRSKGWEDVAAALAHESVLRVDAEHRVAEVECMLRESERFAAMGHFIAEARHGLGNALTSVLGNSELLLLETELGLRDEVRGQLETIHAMSLKIHETLQRLSSLDRAMQTAERQTEREILGTQANAVGLQ